MEWNGREVGGIAEIASVGGLDCVTRCLDRLEIILVDCKKKARVTHFVAIPCNAEEVQNRFEAFRIAITGSNEFHVRILHTHTQVYHLLLTGIDQKGGAIYLCSSTAPDPRNYVDLRSERREGN